jgi:hypothetical protein
VVWESRQAPDQVRGDGNDPQKFSFAHFRLAVAANIVAADEAALFQA